MKNAFKTLAALAFLTLPLASVAQSAVAVTATVTGANSAPYAFGSYQIQLVDSNSVPINNTTPAQTQFAGSLDSNGALSVNLYPNSAFLPPAGATSTLWKFTVCSARSGSPAQILSFPQCYSSLVTVTSAGDYSSQVSTGAVSVYYANLSTGASYLHLPISAVGSVGLSGTSPIVVASTGAISCPTCSASGTTATQVGVQNQSYVYALDTGTANVYAIAPSPAIVSYVAGLSVVMNAANANTGASTINVNGLGAKTIKYKGGTADLVSGDIAAGQIVRLTYDGTNFQMQSQTAGVAQVAFGGTGSSAAPSAGQIPIGNAGGTAYAPQTLTGDYLLSSSGAVTYKAGDSAQVAGNVQLASTQTALSGTGRVRIALVGDSYAVGAQFTSYANTIPAQLTTWLQTQYGYGGTGIKTPDGAGGEWQSVTGCSLIGNLGPTQSGYTTNFNTLRQCTGNTNGATFKNANGGGLYGDTLKIYCALFTDSDNGFTVSIDGGAGTTVCNTTNASFVASTATIVSTAGFHSVTFTWPATGNAYFYGAEWISGTTGVVVDDYGKGGAVAASFGTTPSAQLAFVQQPSVVIFIDQVNDYANSVAPATYQANMQSAINYLQTTFTPEPSFLFLIEPFVTGSYTYTQAQYQSAEYALSTDAGAMYVDLQQRYRSLANQQALGVMAADNVHLKDVGWRDVSTLIENRIQKRMDEFIQDFMFADSGAGNLFVGSTPGEGLAAMLKSTIVGFKAGGTGNFTNTGGNSIFGYQAANALTTGHNNTCIGNFACGSLTSGNNTFAIGQNANTGTGTSGSGILGNGTNSTNNTLQFASWNFLDTSGNLNSNLLKMAVGTAIASASTIAPITGIVHVTGTTTINTITVPTVAVSGGSYTGCVVLIPDGLWSTGTSGNISVATTAVVGSGVTECYDGTKWNPVNGNGTISGVTAGTGMSGGGTSGTVTLNSNAVYQMSFQPGLLTAITNTKSVFAKVSKATTVDNIIGSSMSFTCTVNPTITMYECGTDAACATSPTTIGTVTVTAAGTATVGTVNSASITAGDYVGWALSAGTCTALDISANAQVHSN